MRSYSIAKVVLLGMVLGLLPDSAIAQSEFSIPSKSTAGFTPVTMLVRMDSDSDVQGYVLAIMHTGTVEVTSINASGVAATAGAELVVGEIFPGVGGFTLGVVLDATAPFDGQTIAAASVRKSLRSTSNHSCP